MSGGTAASLVSTPRLEGEWTIMQKRIDSGLDGEWTILQKRVDVGLEGEWTALQ